MVPELDGHVVAPEAVDETVEGAARSARALPGQRRGQRPLAAAGEDLPVPAVPVGQGVEGEERLALLPARQVGLGDDPPEAGVPLGAAGQHHQVGAVRVGHPRTRWAAPVPVRVSSAPNTVGRPTARAAPAKRTTP